MYIDWHNRFETGTIQVGSLFCLFWSRFRLPSSLQKFRLGSDII